MNEGFIGLIIGAVLVLVGGILGAIFNKRAEKTEDKLTPLPPPVIDTSKQQAKAEEDKKTIDRKAREEITLNRKKTEEENDAAKETGSDSVADLLNKLDDDLRCSDPGCPSNR